MCFPCGDPHPRASRSLPVLPRLVMEPFYVAITQKNRVLLTCTLIIATVAVAGLTIYARRALRHWDPEKARDHGLPIPVRTVSVEESTIDETVGATAVTVPSESASLRVVTRNTPKELKAVNVRLGSVVKQGDLLFEFQDAIFKQMVKEREAELAAAQESLTATETLVKQKAASGIDLTTARVKVESAKLELALAQDDLKNCRVTSPLDGVMADVKCVAGEKIDATTEITRVHRLDPILLNMDFPQERIDSLKLGMEAEFVLDSFPQETFKGKVIRISPTADTETRVLPVIIEAANPENRIRAGLTGFVRVRIVKQSKVIPTASLIRQREQAMVNTVDKHNRVNARVVKTGSFLRDGNVEIRDGLDAGEQVVLFGNATLRDQDLVDPDWRGWVRRK
jgi:membrane fusion protein, multidrug efflux system